MKLLTSEVDAEAEKWDEYAENDIVKKAKAMSSMAYNMYLFTRGDGPLKTTHDLFTQAEFFAEQANKMYKTVREFSYEVPGSAEKNDLSATLEKIPIHCQQLQVLVKSPTVGKSATFSKVDSVIQETKNLMNEIAKLVTACFVCATKFEIEFRGATSTRGVLPDDYQQRSSRESTLWRRTPSIRRTAPPPLHAIGTQEGNMLVLFETAAGYAIFKLLDEGKLQKADNIWESFNTPEKAQECLQLVNFKKFKTTSEALESAVDLNDGKLNKALKKLLKKSASDEQLAVGDAKLGKLINEKLELPCVHNSAVAELMRSIRSNIDSLLCEHKDELSAMNLALAHSMGRYKVKFNPEKIDTMIVQAVSLLDDLDKELNNYQMRTREWYGWHFPELGKIITDHVAYAKVVKAIGMRQNAVKTDLSGILPEELEEKVKSDAEISMGTDISELDLIHIQELCDQVIELTDYRAQLSEYLKNRMVALAPNLTVLLGELVGARLISHAGSLVSLAKYPASTIQILGAEKALFRALKTKRDTPKYGLIYHAQLIGQAATAYKGKMARKLAAKVSLSTRIDALGEEVNAGAEVGIEARAYLENQMRAEQERIAHKGAPGSHKQKGGYQFKSEVHSYDASADTTAKTSKKRKFDDEEVEKPKQSKKPKVQEVEEDEDSDE
ncbi:hypothetical protein QR680_008384 [Steinernema hermaphroditum]|uniref:Nop domain-containing protein n=1 Tax=Steinernema hermaphroditum TaxID=289476 RepID=A0AA39IIT3_9BILA|nr:hypothetical protein QR680_008384 [Steinernema hermaphroditum]